MPSKTKRPLRPEDLYAIKTVSDPQYAPDGKRVAYVLSRNDREADETRSSIYVASSNGTQPAKRFRFGYHDSSPRWSPDGRYLAFVAKRGAESQEQLFLSPLDGGDPRQLTDAPFGVSQPAWSPESGRLAYVARTGDFKETKDRSPREKNAPSVVTHLAYKLDGTGFFDVRRQHLFVVDLESEASRQITDGYWNDLQPAWSPDGSQIAFVSDRQPQSHRRHWRRDLWLVAATGGRARKLTRSRGGAAFPAFSPDGKHIAFVGHETGEDLAASRDLLVLPSAGGESPRSLSAGLDRTVVGDPVTPATIAWSPNSSSLVFIAGDRGTNALFRGTLAGAVSRLTDGERNIESLSLAPQGGRTAIVESTPQQPHDVWEVSLGRANGASARGRNLSQANEALLEGVELTRPGRFTFRAEDGLEIEALVLYPPTGAPAAKQRRRPLALEVHGGPHGVYTAWFNLAQQSLAAAGYIVLMPNPRGSLSYGQSFTRGVVGDWGGNDYHDILGAVDRLVERGEADDKQLYSGGYSYGGFMTSWTVGHTDRFQAAAVGAPVADQPSMFGTSDIPLFLQYEIDGTPFNSPQAYQEHSPLTYLPNVNTPVLLYHNEGDLRCPVTQSEEVFQGLTMLGKEVEYVRYPGGYHGVSTPSQLIDRMERKLDWYARHPGRTSRQASRTPKRQPVRA